MTAKSFARAVQQKIEEVVEPIVFDLTTYEVDPKGDLLENGNGGPLLDEEGRQVRGRILKQSVFHATKPSDDALLMAMVRAGRTDASTADRIGGVLDIFKFSLPPSEFRTLIKRIEDPKDEDVTTETLTEVYEWLEEEWTTFPTPSPVDSSPPSATTGGTSTARSRGKVSPR